MFILGVGEANLGREYLPSIFPLTIFSLRLISRKHDLKKREERKPLILVGQQQQKGDWKNST